MNLLPSWLRRPAASGPGLFNRALQAFTTAVHVQMANRWRDQFNPLRGLNIARAVALLEDGERGDYAELQWTYRFIEKRSDVLSALMMRYESGIGKLDWTIKTVPEKELPPGVTAAMADEQRDFLRERFEAVRNLREATDFLCTARFRGYAHLEKVTNAAAMKLADEQPNRYGRLPREGASDEDVVYLQPVEQWYWVRDGAAGEWQYNRDGRFGVTRGEPVNYEQFIIREVMRPVNEIALIAHVRANLCDKDWDGFIETFGIPFIFLVGPPNVPKEREAEYQQTAERIIADSRGYLPNGSDVKTGNAGERGANPFKERMDNLKERVVLVGTGGKLTMLTDSTGIGQGATGAHEDAWDEIVQAEALKISEVIHEQFAAPLLEAQFPGQPPLAYFELCGEDKEDVTQLAAQVAQFSTAGFEADAEELSERAGLTLEKKEMPQAGPGFVSPFNRETFQQNDAMANRAAERKALAGATATALQQLGESQADVLAPVRSRLRAILELRNFDAMRSAWRALKADLPKVLDEINRNPDTARVLENAQVAAFFNSFTDKK